MRLQTTTCSTAHTKQSVMMRNTVFIVLVFAAVLAAATDDGNHSKHDGD